MTAKVAAPRARKSFSRVKQVLDYPHLIDIQKASFQWFLDEGLRETIDWYRECLITQPHERLNHIGT